MEQRTEGRFALDQPVIITLLDDASLGEQQLRGTARVKNASSSGVQLQVSQAVRAGSALKIEVENAMALGEVVYCQPDGEYFLIGIKLEHILSDLANLTRVLLDFADRPATPSAVPQGVRRA